MRRLLFLAIAALPALAQPGELKVPSDADRVEVYRSVDGYDLRVWMYEPEGHSSSSTAPAVVFFFGAGGHPTRYVPHAKYFASRGMVAIVADYRARRRHGVRYNESVIDAKSAVRWIRANAKEHGIDPRRIAAAGGSAGGYLAVGTATLPGHDAPNAGGGVSPIPDALALFNPPLAVPWKEGQDLDELRDRMGASLESVSPHHHLTKDLPPTIVFHGTADKIAPYSTTEAFCDKAQRLGAPCEVVGYEGAGHGVSGWGGEHNTDVVYRTDLFFRSLGWLDGEVTIIPSQ